MCSTLGPTGLQKIGFQKNSGPTRNRLLSLTIDMSKTRYSGRFGGYPRVEWTQLSQIELAQNLQNYDPKKKKKKLENIIV